MLFLEDVNRELEKSAILYNIGEYISYLLTYSNFNLFTPIKSDKKTYLDIKEYLKSNPHIKIKADVIYTNHVDRKVFLKIDKKTVRNIKLFLMIN